MNNPAADIHIVNLSAPPARSVSRPAPRREPAAMPADGQNRFHVVPTREAPGDSTPAAVGSSDDPRALFEAHLPLVESVIRFVCHRQRLDPSQAEDFRSEVMMRLVENEYDVLRRFQQRSTLRTYLTVVIQRMFLDYRNHLWGKWRPSAEALRLGGVAVRLEILLRRDGYPFDQACEILRTNEHVALARSELADLAARLPVRTRFSLVGEEALETTTREDDEAEAVPARESLLVGLRIRRALAPAVQALSDQDRLILRLRFQDGLSVAEIARALTLDQKPLYRRFESLLRCLRDALEAEGIDRDAARTAVNRKDVDISLALLGEAPIADAPIGARPPTGA
jgi:RNA polymerase sigma factor (sigma-70 family)